MRPAFSKDDLDFAISLTEDLWLRFRGKRILVTGGTGFIGSWLVAVIQHANDVLECGMEIVLVSRDVARARERLPVLLNRDDTVVLEADLQTLDRRIGAVDLCIHAAADVRVSSSRNDALSCYDSIVANTRRVLDCVRSCGASRFLLTSSGAIYGPQPSDIDLIPEDFGGAPNALDVTFAYGNGKRAAEWLTAASASSGFETVIARIFSVIGPGLPLDGSFAAGNFVGNAFASEPVKVRGDGRPLRSYLYVVDLCVWLLRILGDGKNGEAYNVGSEYAVSISDLAERLAGIAHLTVERAVDGADRAEGHAPRYVPSTLKARQELNLIENYTLEHALRKTLAWGGVTEPIQGL